MPLSYMKVVAIIFEVMDKEPSLFDIWARAFIIGVGGFLLCRFRPLFLAAVIPIALLFSVGQIVELHEPYIGESILAEAGRSYFIQSYIASAIQIILPFLGLISRRNKLP